MKYKQYDIEDFLKDKDFINWVKGNNIDGNAFFEKLVEAHPQLKNKLFTARQILLSLERRTLEPIENEKNQVFKNILKGNKSSNRDLIYKQHPTSSYSMTTVLKWAAVLVIVCVSTTIMYLQNNTDQVEERGHEIVTKHNQKGQKSQFQLPDGTTVWLNADSKLSFPREFIGEKRAVTLEGEASFDVLENLYKPFVVKSGDIYTKALGTVFNVNAYETEGDIKIALSEGLLEVSSGNDQRARSVVIKPGEQVVCSGDGSLEVGDFDYDTFAWREGVLYFKQASFDEVIKTLSRWYDVEFKMVNSPSSKDWNYNGVFGKDTSLERVLKSISYAQNIDFSIHNKTVILEFEGL